MTKDRRPQASKSRIESLRRERTHLSQTEFAVQCGIPLRTYQRWIAGETEAKLTPLQWKAMMQILNLQSLDDLPNDFGPIQPEASHELND